MDDQTRGLLDVGARLIEAALKAGADAADAAVVRSHSRGASVRLGKIEDTESAESEDVSLRVFVGQRIATVSADMRADIGPLVERAVAMAKVSPEDPYAGLADPSDLSRDDLDLDLYDDTVIASAALVDEAMALEDAARAVDGVTNSGGAGASVSATGLVLVTSAGFSGSRMRSGFSRSVSVIAGEGVKMQRDYDYDSRLFAADLDASADIGRRAGERTVARVNPRMVPTGKYEIVFDPRVARGLIGHVVGAINGAAIARKTSFLKDRMGAQILPASISITDEPLLRRRPGSRAFDGEGLRGAPLVLVEDGVLRNWILDGATGRELGLPGNARASRSSGGVSPSSTNVIVTPGVVTPSELIDGIKDGIYVTELIGHGVNMVTGDYSRGISGFMIENGVLTFPVSEVTIAGNLADMLLQLTPANDLDTRFSIVSPTLGLGVMTVAGN
ncbi:modulator protein [Aureimonas sp. SA4125]|uniref:TldD/PmbA family protein n=1 Tax=Aureimonas sp. SA4125 TaxID=2826993 RepID=UPI001CC66A41|nr:TldD/PmbA family protein [Aureimonas sp. SA4125]BDA82825.1 modulator protein [Aureimonas sp. SA4125]